MSTAHRLRIAAFTHQGRKRPQNEDCIAVGEWIRLAGVAAAGTATRRRSRDVQRLVNYGIFGWTRNPLYIGNFLIWTGFVIASGVLCA